MADGCDQVLEEWYQSIAEESYHIDRLVTSQHIDEMTHNFKLVLGVWSPRGRDGD